MKRLHGFADGVLGASGEDRFALLGELLPGWLAAHGDARGAPG